MVAVVVAVVLAFTIWEDKLGKFGIVLKVAFAGISFNGRSCKTFNSRI
jgi:hypothetical protein